MPTTVTGTEATLTGLTAGTLYRFRVRARNANGYGPYSAWSEPGTPTAGPPAPPPSAPTLAVSVSVIGQNTTVTNNSCSACMAYGYATASAALSTEGLLGSLTYTWEGRYLRTQIAPYAGQFRFLASIGTEWNPVAAYAAPSLFDCDTKLTKGHYIGSISTGGTPEPALYTRGFVCNGVFAPHYWEVRCTATATAIVNGQSFSVSGSSRSIPFRELWGYDYTTDFMMS